MFGRIRDEVVFDGVYIDIYNGGVGHSRSEFVAKGTQFPIKLLGSVIQRHKASDRVIVSGCVSGRRGGKLLRQTTQRPSVVHPEFPPTAFVKILQITYKIIVWEQNPSFNCPVVL